MAVEFRIKQREDNIQKITIPQIAQMADLGYGAMDNDYCLDFDQVGKFTVMYAPDAIGRGFEVWLEDSAVAMRMPLPATKTDIDTAYSLAKKLCEKFGTDSFICDDEIVPFEHIKIKAQQNITASEGAIKMVEERIKEGSQRSVILFGAVNPITIGPAELEEMGGTLDGFEKLLHRLQSMDVFYANAKYYQMKDGTVFGLFILRDNVTTVLPRVPVSLNGPIEKLKGYYVHLPDDNDVPYEVFAENVTPIGDYDSGHVMVCLTEKNIAYLVENCAVAVDTDNRRKGVYWGRILDDGRTHENKIKNMQLSAPQYSGYNHLAVFLRWAAEKDLLSDKLIQMLPDAKKLITDPQSDIRQLIATFPAFGGRLRSFHFKKEAQRFVNKFYAFGRVGYPNCVDEYAEKVLGSEKYNCEEYKNEAYLFVPYDEKYYKGLSKYIEKEWKKFR